MGFPVCLSPLAYELVKRIEVVSDPRCFRRLSRQQGKSGHDRFHHCWVWYVNFVRALERRGVVQVAKQNGERPAFKGFINLRLSDADKETLAADAETDVVGLIDSAASLLYEGYKLGFAYDKTSGSVQATLTCWVEGHADFGYAISSRHPDFDRALHTLLFKHFTLSHECWTDHNPPTPVQTWD